MATTSRPPHGTGVGPGGDRGAVMPYQIRRTGSRGWGVQNTETAEWHSRDTTLEKAQYQIALLQAREHGWHPSGGPPKRHYKPSAWRPKD